MSNYLDSIYTALNNLVTIIADYISAYDLNVTNTATMNNATIKNLSVTGVLNYPLNYVWSNLINQASTLVGTNQIVKSNFINNITQTAGSCQFLDSSMGSITQAGTSVIVQSGNQWNQLKQTQVTDLSITGQLTLPSNIVIAGSTYNNDLVLNNATIQQTITGAGINTLGATDFYNGDVRINKNFTMIGGAGTIATLKNLVVQGTSTLGLITGTTITDLYSTKLNKIGDTVTNVTFAGTVTGLSKSNVALGNCDNTSDLLKPVSTATNTALNNKANLINPSFPNNILLSGSTGLTTGNLLWQDATNFMRMFVSSSTCFIDYFGSLVIRRCSVTGSSPSSVLSISSTGNVSLSGTLAVPNITLYGSINTISTSELLCLDNVSSNIQSQFTTQTTNVATNTTNITTNTTNITSLQTELNTNVTNTTTNTTNITSLQTQVTNILNTPNVETITIGSANAIASGSNPYITNTGTETNQILNFFLPRGADGDKGSTGDKGNTGNTGSEGPQGPQGDATGATIAAGVSAGFAATAAGAAVVSASSAASSASSAAISTANLALMQDEVAGLQTQINTLGNGMTQIDNDIIALKSKTQNISAVGTTTFISNTLETGNIINSGTLYSAGNATITGSVTANNFSGGLLPTNLNGPSISIGTNEVLFNTVTIGSATTITTINGIVNYTNPFNNFFAQF